MTREELTALRDALDAILTLPDSVFQLLAHLLAPPAAKPNGHDRHPPPTDAESSAPPAPVRRPPRASLQRKPVGPAGDRKLLQALADNPGLTVAKLAKAAGVGRSVAGERLRRLARDGSLQKDGRGRRRLTGAQGDASRPILASPAN